MEKMEKLSVESVTNLTRSVESYVDSMQLETWMIILCVVTVVSTCMCVFQQLRSLVCCLLAPIWLPLKGLYMCCSR